MSCRGIKLHWSTDCCRSPSDAPVDCQNSLFGPERQNSKMLISLKTAYSTVEAFSDKTSFCLLFFFFLHLQGFLQTQNMIGSVSWDQAVHLLMLVWKRRNNRLKTASILKQVSAHYLWSGKTSFCDVKIIFFSLLVYL